MVCTSETNPLISAYLAEDDWKITFAGVRDSEGSRRVHAMTLELNSIASN